MARGRHRSARTVAALAVVAVAVLAGAGRASAHATLQATTPPDGAHLAAAPAAVSMTFSEDVTASLGAVKVVDGSGRRVDTGDVVVDGRTASLALQDGLGDGSYVVTWRVISADSHPARGAFTFSVGTGAGPSAGAVAGALDEGADRSYDVAAGVARGFAYGGALLAAGGAVFLVVVHDGAGDERLLRAIVRFGAGLGELGVLAALPLQAALATGLGLGAITERGVLADALARGVGWSSITTLLGLVLVVVGVGSTRRQTIALAGAALAAGGFALAGHTTESSPVALADAADVAHLLAVAVWLGGVVLLAVVLLGRDGGDAISTAQVVRRFSALATAAVLVAGATGALLGWLEVRRIDALTSTRYGWLLVAKVGVVATIAALGAYNHFRLVPALEQAPKRAGARLRTTVQLEALAMVVVVGLTAALVNTTPPSAGRAQVQSVVARLGSGSVDLVVDPARAGANAIHLYLLDEAGHPLAARSVALELSLPAAELGPIDRDATLAGDGHYQLDGGDLSVAGTWTIVVRARIDTFTEQTATLQVTVAP